MKKLNDLEILGLTKKECSVLNAIYADHSTPTSIAKYTKLTRPTVYVTLTRLKKRSLVRTTIRSGTRNWLPATPHQIATKLTNAKRSLAQLKYNVDEIPASTESSIFIYRGAKAIRDLLTQIMESHPKQRVYSLQGNEKDVQWNKVFSHKQTQKLNKTIKENGIIVDGISPQGFLLKQAQHFGTSWIKSFMGRASSFYEIDESYFEHGGQVWIFQQCVYLVSMREEIVIAVHSSEIQKMILAMFTCMKDHAEMIDVNTFLDKYLEHTTN